MATDWNDLDRRLGSAEEWATAARQLQYGADPKVGVPPAGLVRAIADRPPDQDEALLNVARAWARLEMSRAVLDALRVEEASKPRSRLAWLLKTVLATEHSSEAIALVLAEDHDGPERASDVSIWLTEGLERLAYGGALSWPELEAVMVHLEGSPIPGLRAKAASLFLPLPWRDSNVPRLEALLNDSDAEVVTAAVHTLTMHPDAASTLDSEVIERLQNHPDPWVREVASKLAAAIAQVTK